MHRLGHAGQLLRRGVAIAVYWVTEDDDGVKASERSVGVWRQQPGNHSAAKKHKNQQERA
jgi:hypothetical protein